MGGVLARLYAGEYQGIAYYRDDNLMAGDMHKLITLDTPHWGSKLANCGVNENGTITTYGSVAEVAVQNCVTCGAVFDLRVGIQALLNMPSTTIPSHAIVGVGGPAVLNNLDVFTNAASTLPGWLGGLGGFAHAVVNGTEYTLQDVFGQERHDLLVSELSQIGGIGANAISTFDASLLDWAVHTTVTHEARINEKVIELLNAPAVSSAGKEFVANDTHGINARDTDRGA